MGKRGVSDGSGTGGVHQDGSAANQDCCQAGQKAAKPKAQEANQDCCQAGEKAAKPKTQEALKEEPEGGVEEAPAQLATALKQKQGEEFAFSALTRAQCIYCERVNAYEYTLTTTLSVVFNTDRRLR